MATIHVSIMSHVIHCRWIRCVNHVSCDSLSADTRCGDHCLAVQPAERRERLKRRRFLFSMLTLVRCGLPPGKYVSPDCRVGKYAPHMSVQISMAPDAQIEKCNSACGATGEAPEVAQPRLAWPLRKHDTHKSRSVTQPAERREKRLKRRRQD